MDNFQLYMSILPKIIIARSRHMKEVIQRALIALFLAGTTLFAAPSWYYTLKHQLPNFYIGYGQGTSEAIAKRAALESLSEQISVSVNSEVFQNTNVTDGKVKKEFNVKSSVVSSARISGYEVIKADSVNGRYYIALGYENIPGIDKFNRELNTRNITKNEHQNNYLRQCPIAKKVSKNIDFDLKRKDGLWYLQYQDIFQVLSPADFEYFFTSLTSEKLQIITDRDNRNLHDGDRFYFNVTSQESGYVTVFTVYENGTVATLISNIAVQRGEIQRLPDEENMSALEAGLIEQGKETFDLYVAVFSPDKHYFDQFACADEALVQNERYKNFDALIGLMGEMEFATVKVVTKP